MLAIFLLIEGASPGNAQPAITRQPAPVTVAAGRTFNFSVAATGTGALAYQWFFRGEAIPEARSPILRLTSVGVADLGEYRVVVKDSTGEVESQPATLSLTAVVQPDFNPGLRISLSDKLTLSWKGEGVVETSGSLAGPWNSVGSAKNSISTPLPATPAFFRIRNPHPRQPKVFIPSSYREEQPVPLVLFLHGYGGTGNSYESALAIQAQAEAKGFLYCNPDGVADATGRQFWNASETCCDFDDSQVNDVAYLRELILKIAAEYNVDRRRIHLTGHSNGGFMSFRMARDHSELIASIAPFAGTMDQDADHSQPSGPVSVLLIHGTSDEIILYGGGAVGAGLPVRGIYTSAREAVRRWADWNGCGELEDDPTPALDLISSLPGPDTIVSRAEGPGGVRVELWSIQKAGHWPNLSTTFTERLIDWLLAHPK